MLLFLLDGQAFLPSYWCSHVAAWVWTYECTNTCKLNTALCFTCENIWMFGVHIKGQKPIGFASSGKVTTYQDW